jgi:hypothetical protein
VEYDITSDNDVQAADLCSPLNCSVPDMYDLIAIDNSFIISGRSPLKE